MDDFEEMHTEGSDIIVTTVVGVVVFVVILVVLVSAYATSLA